MMKLIKAAKIVWDALILFQKAVMVIGGCVIALLILTEVFLRYVLASPLFGVEELILFIAMWLYFIGASYGSYERSHIQAELLHVWFKDPRSYARVKTLSCSITVFLAITMVKWSYPYFVWGITRGAKSQALLLPMVVSQSAVFVGSILMCIYFITELVDYFCLSIGKSALFAPTLSEDV